MSTSGTQLNQNVPPATPEKQQQQPETTTAPETPVSQEVKTETQPVQQQ